MQENFVSGHMSMGTEIDLPTNSDTRRIVVVLGLVIVVMVGVAVFTLRRIDTVPSSPTPVELYTPFTHAPLPAKDRPEYAPPPGKGSQSRTR